jgi:hypothetical protein
MTAAEAMYPARICDDYGTARYLLRQYEGWLATARAVGGLALFGLIAAIPPGLLALSVWVVHGKIAAYGVGLLSLLTGWLPTWAYRRRLWELPVRRSLARRTAFDPRGAQVSVNIARADIEAARAAIRRAGLIVVYTRTRGDPLALPLNASISVARPISPPQVDYLAAREAVCKIFGSTPIQANVGGIHINAPVAGTG